MNSIETKPLTFTTTPVGSTENPITQLNNQNICAPITTENYGVKFVYTDSEGSMGSKYNQLISSTATDNTTVKTVKKEWHMTLLPAMASKFASGWQVPNAMPGLNFRVKQDLVKKKLLGGGSVYQNLGSNEIEIMMVGIFTGDGGVYRISDNGTDWGSPIASYEILNIGGKFGAGNTMTNPPYNTGNRLIADQLGIPAKYGYKTADEFFKGSAPNLGKEPDYLRDQFGETLFIRKDVSRRGMFDRIGCPSECELSYRPGLTGDITNPDRGIKYGEQLTKNTFDFLPDYTYTAKELDALNDGYLEAVAFYQMAIKSARTLDVEINLRKTRDGLVPYIPKDAYGREYASPLRNGISNPKFKAVVKDMELYVSRSNRVWYTLILQVVQADEGTCLETIDSKPSTLLIKEDAKDTPVSTNGVDTDGNKSSVGNTGTPLPPSISSCRVALQNLASEMNKAGIETNIKGDTLKYNWNPNSLSTETYLDASLVDIRTNPQDIRTTTGSILLVNLLKNPLIYLDKVANKLLNIRKLALNGMTFDMLMSDLNEIEAVIGYLYDKLSRLPGDYTIIDDYSRWFTELRDYFTRNYRIIMTRRPTFKPLSYPRLPSGFNQIQVTVDYLKRVVSGSAKLRGIIKRDILRVKFANLTLAPLRLASKFFGGITGGIVLDILLQLIFPEATNAQVAPEQTLLNEFTKETGCKLRFNPPDAEGFFSVTISK
jgi:hypothetical protein